MTLLDQPREIVAVDRPIGRPRWHDIIDDVCRDHRIARRELIQPTVGAMRFVPARIDAAKRLRAAGYKMIPIGRMLGRNHTTIAWYLGRRATKPQPVHQP